MEYFYGVLGSKLSDFKFHLAKWELVEIRKHLYYNGFVWCPQQSESLEAILNNGLLVLVKLFD